MTQSKCTAPIALFTYNREQHTRQTVEALAANDLACDSDLFVFSDAPRSEEQREKVMQVRNYIRTITGFRSITLVEREENFGLARSIIEGVSALVRDHGNIIVLEDDLETSPFFLRYMNEALELYKNDERVISIHGYTYPVKATLPETFFLKGADCWGWATWQRGWNLFEQNGEKLLSNLNKKRLGREFDFNGTYPFKKMLEKQVNGKNDSWAIRWNASAFLSNKLTLYPGRSLVHNIGNDASGKHCGISDKYDVILSATPVQVGNIPIEVNHHAVDAFARYFNSLKPAFFEKLTSSFSKRYKKLFTLRQTKRAGYFGDYANWEAAEHDSEGYDSDAIIDKVTGAMLMVRDGRAAFERDSVAFDSIQYSWPLLTALLWIASQHENKLRLIDFGGSLGSSYYQNIGFLKHLNNLSWNVVEQDNFVERGKKLFTNDHLHFFNSIEDCLREHPCEVILFASVLPYLKAPYDLLNQVVSKEFKYIIIDRTPMLEEKNDRLTVQHVPPEIYRASYPAWFFSREKLIDFFMPHYELVSEFDSLVPKIKLANTTAFEKGFVFKKRD